jgi:hypothetical protein
MPEPDTTSDCAEDFLRERNRLAHELAGDAEGERITDEYLAKEQLMNAYTLALERVRDEKGRRKSDVYSCAEAGASMGRNSIIAFGEACDEF